MTDQELKDLKQMCERMIRGEERVLFWPGICGPYTVLKLIEELQQNRTHSAS